MIIQVKKLSASKNPMVETAEKSEYNIGSMANEKSLFVDYEAIGIAQELPKEGSSFSMMRYERNGQKCAGLFATSPIVKVTDTTFETANSIYEWEEIKPKMEE